MPKLGALVIYLKQILTVQTGTPSKASERDRPGGVNAARRRGYRFPGGRAPPSPRRARRPRLTGPLRSEPTRAPGSASRRHATSPWATPGPPERCRDAPASGRPQPPPPQARGGDAVQGLAPEGKPRGPRRRGVRGPDSSGESRSRLPQGGRPPRRALTDLERCFRICFLMSPAMVPGREAPRALSVPHCLVSSWPSPLCPG